MISWMFTFAYEDCNGNKIEETILATSYKKAVETFHEKHGEIEFDLTDIEM